MRGGVPPRAGQTLFDTAAHAFLPAIVRREDLPVANSRLFAARIAITSFIGPPVGGVLFAAAAVAPFLLDATSFGVAALLVGAVLTAPARQEADARQPLRRDISEGLGYVWRHTVLRRICGMIAVVNLTQSATQSILVLFALERLSLDQRGYGLLLAAGGVGGMLSGVVGSPPRRRVGPGRVLAATPGGCWRGSTAS